MIYTSYFGNLKNLPPSIIPISICGKAPVWYNGLQYKQLAPKWSFFKVWKENNDNDYYIKHFNDEVLSKLQQTHVVADLHHLCDKCIYENLDVALICYEKPDDFCHRHLVAQWLIDGGYECEEYNYETV